jgi:hypothetical protein
MKHMSIQAYSRACVRAKTPWARAVLFVRSLSLRYVLWHGQQQLNRREAANRALRAVSANTGSSR